MLKPSRAARSAVLTGSSRSTICRASASRSTRWIVPVYCVTRAAAPYSRICAASDSAVGYTRSAGPSSTCGPTEAASTVASIVDRICVNSSKQSHGNVPVWGCRRLAAERFASPANTVWPLTSCLIAPPVTSGSLSCRMNCGCPPGSSFTRSSVQQASNSGGRHSPCQTRTRLGTTLRRPACGPQVSRGR